MALLAAAQDHWRRFRNGLLASPHFQKFAIDFSPFRPISRRRSRQLFDLLAGFAYSQILYATVKLGLIDLLKDTPMEARDLAAKIGWPADSLERLLKAAVALDLLERDSKGRFTLGIHGAALAGNPWIGKFITHHGLLYRDLADPLPLLKGEVTETDLKRYWGYAGHGGEEDVGPENAARYTALMAASQQAVASEILATYDFTRHVHLMDVGGSNGTFLKAAAERHPHLELTLFDLPAVCDIARETLSADQLTARVTFSGGSFLADPLPRGADVITLIRILHDHDDDAVLNLLTRVRAALTPHGRLVIAEPLSGIRSIAPVSDAYFGLYFLAMGQGRTRSAAEIGTLLRQAGFQSPHLYPARMPLIASVIEAAPADRV